MKPATTDIIAAYRAVVSAMLVHPTVLTMGLYRHHGNTSCLSHCLYVSYISWRWACLLGLRPEEAARGALLHDMFLYDWHQLDHDRPHAFKHPGIALNNALRCFDLTPCEIDIIAHHMWPVTLAFPRSPEAYLVGIADKYCSVMDTFGLNRRFCLIRDALLGVSS